MYFNKHCLYHYSKSVYQYIFLGTPSTWVFCSEYSGNNMLRFGRIFSLTKTLCSSISQNGIGKWWRRHERTTTGKWWLYFGRRASFSQSHPPLTWLSEILYSMHCVAKILGFRMTGKPAPSQRRQTNAFYMKNDQNGLIDQPTPKQMSSLDSHLQNYWQCKSWSEKQICKVHVF